MYKRQSQYLLNSYYIFYRFPAFRFYFPSGYPSSNLKKYLSLHSLIKTVYYLVFEAPADVKDFGLVYLEEYYTGSESESGTGDFFSVNFTVE